MMWTDSSQQIFFIVRLYGPYVESRSACWATIAAASTSQAMMPTSPHDLRWVVEDVVELGLAVEQVLVHGFARLAQVLRHAVEQLGVAASSCTLAVSASFRLSVGARMIHSRSGSTPISSELACISTKRSTLVPVFVGHPVARPRPSGRRGRARRTRCSAPRGSGSGRRRAVSAALRGQDRRQ